MLVAPFTMVEIWNKLGYPQMDDWIKKIWSMYAVEYYSAINKDGFFFFICSKMGATRIHCSQ